jgi:hypothetical protein
MTRGKSLKRCLERDDVAAQEEPCFEVASGLPWTCDVFLRQACNAGHPGLRDMGVPPELEVAVRQNVEWSDLQMSNYRIAWCRKWMARAHELDVLEREDAAATSCSR